MRILKSLLGLDKQQAWEQIAADIGGSFHKGGFWKDDVLSYLHDEWEITLDTYTVNSGKHSTTYTRMRAPFTNQRGFYFKVYREHFFAKIGKLFKMQDIEIGDPFFDDKFIIKGNDEREIASFLNDEELKRLIDAQKDISFQIKDDDGWFSSVVGATYPEGVDELYFQRVGVLKDPEVLKGLFDLFIYTLDRMRKMDVKGCVGAGSSED